MFNEIVQRLFIKVGASLLCTAFLIACSSDSDSNTPAEVLSASKASTWPAVDVGAHLEEELRKVYEDLTEVAFFDVDVLLDIASLNPPPPTVEGMSIEDIEVPGFEGGPAVTLRIFHPDDIADNAPGIYNIHGGGFIVGFTGMDDIRNISLARELGAIVISPEYRLAPVSPFPASLDDCYAGLVWFSDNASELGVDASRIIIAGSSAGAGLAAGVALKARDLGGPQIFFQLLVYPMLDDRNETRSSYRFANSKIWGREQNRFAWDLYLGDAAESDYISSYAVPARASDLSNLPPTHISIGTAEIFLDENIAYAKALLRAGVMVELHVYPGAFHGADNFPTGLETTLIQRWKREELDALHIALEK